MVKRVLISMVIFSMVFWALPVFSAEIGGVQFLEEKSVAGKTLKLNGLAMRKAFGFIKVFTMGLYLENPTNDAGTIIESKQVKHFYIHYLTGKATAEKLQSGFIEGMSETNAPELVEKHNKTILKHASWLDVNMKPGFISEYLYVPGKGLTLTIQGVEKGTINNEEYIQMYFRNYLGDKAGENIREGLLGR